MYCEGLVAMNPSSNNYCSVRTDTCEGRCWHFLIDLDQYDPNLMKRLYFIIKIEAFWCFFRPFDGQVFIFAKRFCHQFQLSTQTKTANDSIRQ